ncbi:hypothetical protein CCAX7_16780 [Capsulimonas corticalis]|uniref:Uncharacterized protein n=1 Tax=Capsulimonas corticalis TaxID=2219043 RepID=A0A402CYT7_9BACT|nr:hypothetical protein [Capsulimonas corticalis]BDI29627.1 hypothetical protein CCAX7_16780 [Capsulimonas corticalis]
MNILPKALLLILCGLPLSTPAMAATLTRTTWQGQDAYRLSDGKTEAIIAPAWGRVMRYGFVGGLNVLWNAEPDPLQGNGYKNRGGAKTWPAPQSEWPLFAGDLYPPHPSWDGAPLAAKAESDHLRLTGPVWEGWGTRLTLDFDWTAVGELKITQTLEKVKGEARRISIWQNTQIAYPDAVFLPMSDRSAYHNGFYWFFGGPAPEYADAATTLSPTLLRLKPVPAKSYKVGVDAPIAALVSVKDGTAFLMRSPIQNVRFSPYPDGADGAGFPACFYNQGGGGGVYDEMELLSPLYLFRKGDRHAQTVRWSLRRLSSPDLETQAAQAEIEALLETPSPSP